MEQGAGRLLGGGRRPWQGVLAFEALLEQIADGAIGGVTEGQGHAAGGIEALGAILLGEGNDALALAQVMQGMLGEEVTGMVSDALGDYFGTHPGGAERIQRFERVFQDQRIDIERNRYYVGKQNFATITPGSIQSWDHEYVTGRIYPPE